MPGYTPPTDSDRICANLARVRTRIANAARAASREPSNIRLIAVSKTHAAERIHALARAGQRDFGENRIQEALGKMDALASDGLVWHFVGRLQSNKAKLVPGRFQWLHTLDSLPLASKLSEAGEERHATVDCLIQVNVISDPAKGGVTPAALPSLVESIQHAGLASIRLRGLMTIGPRGGDEIQLRNCFSVLRELRDATAEQSGLSDFDQLSMGMTTDLEPAILEGATMVRVGSGIFGPR
jgi:pyridoxal phosphate enzyme (YggS family)